jgi:hypothetical protein
MPGNGTRIENAGGRFCFGFLFAGEMRGYAWKRSGFGGGRIHEAEWRREKRKETRTGRDAPGERRALGTREPGTWLAHPKNRKSVASLRDLRGFLNPSPDL